MVREGRRREFPTLAEKAKEIPDPQSLETFARSKLAWDEPSRPRHAELLDWHKTLIRLRRSNPSLCDGRMEEVSVCCDERARWLTVERGPWSVACNLGQATATAPLRKGAHEVVAASDVGILLSPPTITLPPDSVAILKLE
jgi:maltooligosyltrehalose trehalohydrolase